MPSLMRLYNDAKKSSEQKNSNLELVQGLLSTLEIFKGQFSTQELKKLDLTNSPSEQELFKKIGEIIKKLPENKAQTKESSLESFKEKFENADGLLTNFKIILEFFKEVVWDYSLNLFSIMMGSKNPAAELYEYTNQASQTILSNLKANGVDEETYKETKNTLQNIKNQLWVMQKEQKIQNCEKLVNFKLAGLIFASSFALATLSIISPIIGIQIGFGSIMSALYLSAGVASFSAASFVLSYLNKADLAVRGNEYYATKLNRYTEDTMTVVSDILEPMMENIYSLLGYKAQGEAVKNYEYETAATSFIIKMNNV